MLRLCVGLNVPQRRLPLVPVVFPPSSLARYSLFRGPLATSLLRRTEIFKCHDIRQRRGQHFRLSTGRGGLHFPVRSIRLFSTWPELVFHRPLRVGDFHPRRCICGRMLRQFQQIGAGPGICTPLLAYPKALTRSRVHPAKMSIGDIRAFAADCVTVGWTVVTACHEGLSIRQHRIGCLLSLRFAFCMLAPLYIPSLKSKVQMRVYDPLALKSCTRPRRAL